MTQSNIKPIYPAGIFPWADRVDNVNVDFANDINSVVADLESVETTVGTNPQIEPNPPTGLPITYSTVSARITDAMTNNNLPFCSLSTPSQTFTNNTTGQVHNYRKNYDPYNMYNGTDVTIPVNGFYVISATQLWPWGNNGYGYVALLLNGTSNIIADHLIDWQFSGNIATGTLQPGAIGVPPPRWILFGNRPRLANLSWAGLLHKNDRISVATENGTASATIIMTNMFLKVACMRTLASNAQFTSG